jgi:hypothetical protein
MPASRRASASEHDDELASHLENLRLAGERSQRTSPAPLTTPQSAIQRSTRFGDSALSAGATYNPTVIMFDQQLDLEMNGMCFASFAFLVRWADLRITDAMKRLPTSDNDKFPTHYGNKVSILPEPSSFFKPIKL